MYKNFRVGMAMAVACAGLGASTEAFASIPNISDGLKFSSENEQYTATLGARIHYDYAAVSADNIAISRDSEGYFRRAYLGVYGKVHGVRYKLENDFSNSDTANKDIWIGANLPAGRGLVRIGHMQPAYGLEELTNSNEILFTERPYLSSSTIYSGREYQNALSYNAHAHGLTSMVSVYDANGVTGNDKIISKSGGGHGFAGRVTYAAHPTAGALIHVGIGYDSASFHVDSAGTGATGGAAIVGHDAGRNGPKIVLIPAGYKSEKTMTVELAGNFGPAYLQGEYAQAKFDGGSLTAPTAQTLNTYYIQTSVFVTGETKPYKSDIGVFGSPKPINKFGAIELKARYDYIKNKDTATTPVLTTISVGANYYFNSNIRLMLDYNIGKSESTLLGNTTTDKPTSFVARFQLAF